MKVSKIIIVEYLKYFLPRSLTVGFVLALATTVYLFALSTDWIIIEIVKALIIWQFLWSFALMCILPKLSARTWKEPQQNRK